MQKKICVCIGTKKSNKCRKRNTKLDILTVYTLKLCYVKLYGPCSQVSLFFVKYKYIIFGFLSNTQSIGLESAASNAKFEFYLDVQNFQLQLGLPANRSCQNYMVVYYKELCYNDCKVPMGTFRYFCLEIFFYR